MPVPLQIIDEYIIEPPLDEENRPHVFHSFENKHKCAEQKNNQTIAIQVLMILNMYYHRIALLLPTKTNRKTSKIFNFL